MSPKKKITKKSRSAKAAAGRKMTLSKKTAGKKQAPKKLVKKKRAQGSTAVKSKSTGKKKITAKAASASKKQARKKKPATRRAFLHQRAGTYPAGQSGDVQGLSRIEGADSESVEELLEEGNAFEADVVTGVEEAEGSDEREVRTHEVPEDDVPSEYLDKDSW
jgi:hypothetical protein